MQRLTLEYTSRDIYIVAYRLTNTLVWYYHLCIVNGIVNTLLVSLQSTIYTMILKSHSVDLTITQ